MLFSTVFSTWSRILIRALPDGMVPLLAPVSSISSMVELHLLSALLSGFSKYVAVDPDAGSTDGRALGSGVVLRLRGAAEALPPPGLVALPLLLVVGAMVAGLAWRNAGGCGGVASTAGGQCAPGLATTCTARSTVRAGLYRGDGSALSPCHGRVVRAGSRVGRVDSECACSSRVGCGANVHAATANPDVRAPSAPASQASRPLATKGGRRQPTSLWMLWPATRARMHSVLGFWPESLFGTVCWPHAFSHAPQRKAQNKLFLVFYDRTSLSSSSSLSSHPHFRTSPSADYAHPSCSLSDTLLPCP